MYVRVCSVTLLLILLEQADAFAGNDPQQVSMDATFRQRTRADWEKVWHHESHTRCRDKLLRHLFWACDQDIYRMERRNGGPEAGVFDHHAAVKKSYDTSQWLDPQVATQMLRTRRSRRRNGGTPPSSITAECCSRTGCTWEEYAEYCPTNKRQVDIK